ncbi:MULTISPECIES: TetR/AcrR family transcriptional regulator [Pontibacillus]|uniref:TetR/AcrR family transcriptional regulator n=1 Tax=Pontibacillus chungwhensis TaxID=265426 RepID=A0ABY8V6Q1_9BACI|nr:MULTISPECIES: TetR/AcrR family transcriptional regulator [Pontibacillus]MCD5322242.1 TetR/AcrR family transcriptional regulator [Pontibacillus sp. HN14]WIF99536.1 TetR/AcrR family transcriptional regulator [Pontibacillus chungwhensis]
MSKDKILTEALYLFSNKGYEGTALSELAERVGMKKASIYSHFKNKEEIFWAVIDGAYQEEIAKLSRGMKDVEHLPFRERFHFMMDQHVQFYKEKDVNANLWRRMTMFPPEAFKEGLKAKLLEYEEEFNEMIKMDLDAAIHSGEIREVDGETGVAMINCVLDGLFVEYSYYDEAEFNKRVEAVKAMTWRAFAPIEKEGD